MTTADPTTLELEAIRGLVAADLPDYLDDLRRLVDLDCGSYTPAGVDEVGRWVAGFLVELGADVDIRPDPSGRFANTVVGTFSGQPGGPRVVLIGHMDTVFDPGTAAERPFRIEEGIARGPGVTDMKSGLLAGLYALKAIIAEVGGLPFERVTFIANPDEEVGSPSSSPHIRALAADADAALVLECARANGDIVSARKGILDTRLTVHGRAAHAGVEPEKGRSAIHEAARLVRDLHALNGRWPGVTVNVGVIRGGTRPNVVAERCELEVDVRATTGEGLDEVEAAVRAVAAATEVPDVSVEADVRVAWRPMEKLVRSGRLVEHAQDVGRRLGFEVRDAATGGASDANTTSGMGVPSLDGLGPIGGNDHSPAEYLEVDSVVPRTAMVAGLLLAIARDPEVLAWRDDDPRFAGHASSAPAGAG
jgi:glutamate carboxypeptidase